MESRTLRSHRVIGAVADDAASAASFYTLGGQGFCTTRVCDDAFHVVALEKLRVVMTSPRLGRKIDALASCGEWTYAAVGAELWAFERGKVRGRVDAPADDAPMSEAAPITHLLAIGAVIIVVRRRDDEGSFVEAWTTGSKGADKHKLPKLSSSFDVCGSNVQSLAHPPTYLNKVVFGTASGRVELWNLRSKTKVHTMKCVEGNQGPITCIEPSGVLDVVALTHGKSVEVINLKLDESLFTLQHSSPPTCLAFVSAAAKFLGSESDQGTVAKALLVTGCKSGSLCVWDLEDVMLIEEQKMAHRTSVLRMFAGGFGAGENAAAVSATGASAVVLTTIGADNAIAQWVFDGAAGGARCVRRREGHAVPPSLARWYGPPQCGGALAVSQNGGDAANSLQLMTCGADGSVRVSHAARDALNCELSQGAGLERRAKKLRLEHGRDALKLPEPVALAACDSSNGLLPNVITAHSMQRAARCWNFSKRVISNHSLTQPQWDRSGNLSSKDEPEKMMRATSVALSQCGNFALVGHADGVCRKYSVQSGISRGEYPSNLAAAAFSLRNTASVAVPGSIARAGRAIERGYHKGELAASVGDVKRKRTQGAHGSAAHVRGAATKLRHNGAVTGIYIDNTNHDVVTSSTDATLRWWDFTDHGLVHKLAVPAAVACLASARDSNLFAAGCDDGVVRVYDARPPPLGAIIVRSLRDAGGTGPPREVAWSPTFSTLWAACGDGSARCWELASGACVDWLDFGNDRGVGGCTSISVSPTGEFVATTHVGQRGIALWSDKAAYERVDAIRLEAGKNEPCKMAIDDDNGALAQFEQLLKAPSRTLKPIAVVVEKPDDVLEKATLAPGVLTANDAMGAIRLSGEARSKIEALYMLDAIAERNRPVAPPKKPEAAPFFLPTARLEDAFAPMAAAPAVEDAPVAAPVPSPFLFGKGTSKISRHAVFDAAHRCELATLSLAGDATPLLKHLEGLSPNAIDGEISLLCRGVHDEPGLALLAAFLAHLAQALASHAHFEAIQAYMHRCIVRHSQCLRHSDLKPAVVSLHAAQASAAERARHILHEPLCLLEFYSKNLHGSA
ncbi:WD40-repeat-containing domain protein [Pelagophyceae sp. CCMP2097]|nr:WD40-repeat-containing domain protein [Pelagophyceae sp. CCMP2097]